MNKSFIKILTSGSVDSGKSTLLGRILYDTENFNLDELESVINRTKLNQSFKYEIDYSFFLDGLLDETTEGITIDLAHKYFVYDDKNYVFIDSPGHIEYLQNTASGATFADIAILMIDVEVGITTQTFNHLEIIGMFKNIKKIVICINKIDSSNNPEEDYLTYKKEIEDFCKKLNINNFELIPVSAIEGINIKKNNAVLPFYRGLSLLEIISNFNIKNDNGVKGSLTAVQDVLIGENNKRYLNVINLNENIKTGKKLTNIRTNEIVTINKIYKNFKEQKILESGEVGNITFDEKATINKSDILVSNNETLKYTSSIKCTLVLLDKENNLSLSERMLIIFKNQKSYGFISKIEKRENSNIIFSITFELESKIIISEYETYDKLSVFNFIDPSTNQTLGFGYVDFSLDKGVHIKESVLVKSTNNKKIIKCFWLTGLPSSGKTTIANEFGKILNKNSIPFYIIDGDTIRSGLNSDLGFSKSDRIENNRRVAHLAKILFDSGIVPIVSTVSPNNSSRNFARSLFNKNDFIEVFVDTPLEECIKRDVKNLYKSSKTNKNITGLHTNYDVPIKPEVIIETLNTSLNQSVDLLYKYLSL